MERKIRASIVGITGYTGLELLRLLLLHPRVEIAHLTSRQHKDEPLGNIAPHLAHLDLRVTDADFAALAADSDIVFLALPHGAAQDAVASLHGKVRLVDLSADFRADDPAVHEKYYGPHKYPHLLREVIYGLPEATDRARVKNAASVANPGCFALLGQLLLYPFKGMIERADIFAVTGSSGAGKTPGEGAHHPVRSHNMKSYNINAHRHIAEITRTAEINQSRLNFVPTSGPFTRGIFAQAFITLNGTDVEKAGDVYRSEPFIRITDNVALANITGSNFCDLSFARGHGGIIMAQGAIDNLVKGAAGTAVQNMNIMFGFDETEGLINIGPVYP